MIRKLLRVTMIVGLVGVVGGLGGADVLQARQDDKEDRDQENGQGKLPPQTLRSGFESTDQLLKDVERAEKAPLHSAWIVESSRFLNVPHRAFQPDVGDPPFVDLPVNVGIIKGSDGKITLYDSGWKQLAYIFNWNTSCCWYGIRA